MSLALIELSAFTASSSAGLAAARSRSASSFTPAICSALAVTSATMSATLAFSFSATAVEAEISFSRLALTRCASARSTFFLARSTFMSLTSVLACSSLDSPFLILSARPCTSPSFWVYSAL